MTITEFLTARLDEEESIARAGVSSQADPENGWGYISDPGDVSHRALTPHVGHIHEDVQAAHIIYWHPYRVLADVAAKRRISFLHVPPQVSTIPGKLCRECADHDDTPRPCATMLALLQPYADHPDFNPEWRMS
jgi:hypothetical protein